MYRTTLFLLALLLPLTALAEEGMWLPEQLPAVAVDWTDRGLHLDPETLADPLGAPLGAIVLLDGCSGSFVSSDGLIATNHHCVQSYLQFLSSAEHDRHRDGYAAASRADELSVGPTGRVHIVDRIDDVTDRVLHKVKRRTRDRQRRDLIDAASKELVAECEQQPHHRCRVASYQGGARYRLIASLELQDLRLVYAPPEPVGQFGGEIDNWMWPRQGADFSLLRAYVAPDGSSAPHAEDNVPYQPPQWLTVRSEPLREGDFVMVAGYPWRTDRHRLAEELRWEVQQNLPAQLELREAIQVVLKDHAARDAESAARLAAPIEYLANGIKYRKGLALAMGNAALWRAKDERQAAFLAWIGQDAARSKVLQPVVDELLQHIAEQQDRALASMYVSWLRRGSDLLAAAHETLRWARQRELPDARRDRGYQDRDATDHADYLRRVEQDLHLASERDVMALVLRRLEAQPPARRAEPVQRWVEARGGVDAALAALYDTPPALADTAHRVALMDASAADIEASDDPWLQLAVALEDWMAPRREQDKTLAGTSQRLRSAWRVAWDGWRESLGDVVAEDANGTLRITLGSVQGFAPQDGLIATPRTTLAGLIAKAGEAPFDVSEAFLKRAAEGPSSRWADPELGDVGVNNLSTLDITGGNSGSAILDGEGRWAGLAFDGNWESMSSDWIYDAPVTRCIGLEIPYLLWVLEGDPAAAGVLAEILATAQGVPE